MNKLQAFSVQQMGIYATVLQCDSGIWQGAITLSVLLKGYYSYKLQFVVHTAISSLIVTARIILQ